MNSPAGPNAFSWGPDRRTPPVGRDTPVLVVLVVIVALLVVAVIGVAVHHDKASAAAKSPAGSTATSRLPAASTTAPSTTSTTVAEPAGFKGLVDAPDHISLGVPTSWQVPQVSNASLATELQAMAAKDPSLVPVLDGAIAALSKAQVGAFAIDVATQTSMYTFGVAFPGATSTSQISTSLVIKSAQAAGGTNIRTSAVRVPLGPAEQVTLQLPVGGATISEAFDYFILGGRLVTVLVSAKGTKAPVTVLRQITATLAPA